MIGVMIKVNRLRRFIIGVVLLVNLAPSLTFAVEKITVLGLFKDKAIVKVDGKQRVLKVSEPSPEGILLISANSEEAVIEIDGITKSYGLGSHIATNFPTPAEGPVVQIWPDAYGMYSIVGNINSYPVTFLVDTGATLIAMNKNEARRLGLDYLVIGTPSQASTASGIVNTYHVTLKKVRVGDITLKDIKATVIDGDFPTEVLLGNSFLNRLDMRRDGKMLELKKKF